LKRISAKSLIVTGRFHMVCMSLLARTPFLALSGNTHKIEGILTDVQLPHRYLTSLSDRRDLISAAEWRDDEAARIDTYLETARSRISEMFSRIREAATV
jgi:polysaccharide pyruvyl transferase WcaK-like protein